MTQETTPLTPQQSFQEAIKDRLRTDIGNLMPDSILQEMIQKSLQEMFFCRREESRGYNGTVIKPSWFDEEVTTQLKTKITELLNGYMEDNKDTLTKAVTEEIVKNSPKLLAAFFIDTLTSASSSQSYNLANGILNNLRDKGLNV